MKRNNQAYLILDVETGGFVPAEHAITQIAFLALDSQTFEQINSFETYIKPYGGLTYTQKALTVTGITMRDINNGIAVEEMVDIMTQFCGDITGKGRGDAPLIVGHNISFDIGFLTKAYKHCGKSLSSVLNSSGIQINRLCTQRMAMQRWKKGEIENYKLGTVVKKLGLDMVDAHRAMNDVLATSKVFIKFTEMLRSEGKSVTSQPEKTKIIPSSKNEVIPTTARYRDSFQF